METKFYVGQRVMSDKFGEGKVEDYDDGYIPVFVRLKSGCVQWYTAIGQVHDKIGSENNPIDLHPIDTPKPVLTEWHRERLRSPKTLKLSDHQIDVIESILSETEPPKYEPKQGDSVLIKIPEASYWIPAVFQEMYKDGGYKCYEYGKMTLCRPFNPELVGKVTND